MLQYDGDQWQLFSLNTKLDVRAICISEKQGRIYVGGESEFGYFEPDCSGRLTYTVLSDSFNEEYNLFGGYWGVYEVDNMLYYVSDRHVVKQIGDKFTAIESPFKIDCSSIINGVLYVGTFDGIWMLVGNTWIPAQGSEIVNKKSIREIVPYKNGFLAATAFDGLFYGDKESVTPYITGAEIFMRQNEIFSMAANENHIAVGTIHKGLLLIDRRNGKLSYYNEQNGLQNNTVLSVCLDQSGDLWLGLDNGIDYISLNTPLTTLYTGPYSKGSGYTSVVDKEKLYLGTNRGLFYTSWPVIIDENAINPELIPELSGQVWGLEKAGEDLFCLHDKGLFVVKDTKAEVISGFRGALMCYPFKNDPDLCWIGSYDGLFLISRKNGK